MIVNFCFIYGTDKKTKQREAILFKGTASEEAFVRQNIEIIHLQQKSKEQTEES